ncbi:unnamed protein product [Periconia digitata]|uniref:COPI associated n=1 Tax=Periconia digitata TaxID=1303443 RepID=A0A9W4UU10_9PLEO|nr:unnamed protein product [Periconia digitata]
MTPLSGVSENALTVLRAAPTSQGVVPRSNSKRRVKTIFFTSDNSSISLLLPFQPSIYKSDKLRFPHLSDQSAGMDFSDVFRIVNFAVAVFMVLGGITKFIGFEGFSTIILGVYLILFGAATALLEIQIPQQVARYASFMFSFLGRGIFYVFIGSVAVGSHWYQYVPGAIVGIVGIGYVVLEWIPSIEPPANMRDADAGWGAEQV